MLNYSGLYDFIIQIYGKTSSILPWGYALPPVRITIEMTYSCNLRCKMCYQQGERLQKNTKSVLSTEEIKRIIDQMPSKSLITLTGGEIFTRPDVFEIINHATKKHYCNIITNAARINDQIAKKIINSGVMLVGISVDGLEETHDSIRGVKGTYQKAMKGIKLIQQEKNKLGRNYPLIDIKMVILPENIKEIYKLYKVSKQLNADFFTISVLRGLSTPISVQTFIKSLSKNELPFERLYPEENAALFEGQISQQERNKTGSSPYLRCYPGNLQNYFSKYINGRVKLGDYDSCNFPWTSFYVSPYGSVFPCINMEVGNIRKQSLRKIWNGEKIRSFRLNLKKQKLFPICQGCCNLKFKQM